MQKKHAAIDIGNSRIKVKINNKIEYFLASDITNLFNFLVENQIRMLAFSSVNQTVSDNLLKKINKSSIKAVNAIELLDKQRIINFSNVRGMGSDRKLGLIGATCFYTPPLVTVDCGTAVTINILNHNNIALGGMIFPGLSTQAKALSKFTNQLPLITTFDTAATIGNDTGSSIQSGIIASVAGGISYALRNISEQLLSSNHFQIIFTGGDGEFIMNTTKISRVVYTPNLVLHGIEQLIKMSINPTIDF